jgi:hypothetical protein
MITIRCTAKAAKALGFSPIADAPVGTSPLGDWYANLIPTLAGELYLFLNEQCLLVVAVPRGTPDLLREFVGRVGNVLSMIGVSNERIEKEIEHFREARIGKTVSKRVLGVMNDAGWRCQETAGRAARRSKLSLSDLELSLALMPQATLNFRTPAEVALKLLQSTANFGAA